MTWRTIVINKRAKLELKLGNLVIRHEDGKYTRVFLGEIAVLIVENTAVALTAALLCELAKRKIKVIFCDEKRNPYSEVIPYWGCFDSSGKIKEQIMWTNFTKGLIWTEIVKNKILQQRQVLVDYNLPGSSFMDQYIENLQFNDVANAEAHAAKVYFSALYGSDFSRSETSCINSAMDYGYAVIMSAFNREISANGYLLQIGLFHDSAQNHFNLACDLMEPFRVLVDRRAIKLNPKTFYTDEKHYMVDVLNDEVKIGGQKQYVLNAIKIYCRSVFDAINEQNPSLIKFYTYEL